jgi:hypothetical protein
MDDAGHKGDHERHDGGQGVIMDVHVHGKVSRPEPLKENKVKAFAAGFDDGRCRHGKAAQKCRAGNDLNELSGQVSAQDSVDGGTRQGKKTSGEEVSVSTASSGFG